MSTLTFPADAPDLLGATLRVEGVSKTFGSHRVLSEVTLEARPGQVHLLIGPNGAGKSTLFNVLTGVHRADAGQVLLDGKALQRITPTTMARAGVLRTFQNLQLFDSLTVRENFMVAAHGVRARSRSWRRSAEDILHLVGLNAVADRKPGTLSFGERRFVEIGRALAAQPRVLLMDEPAAGLSAADRDRLKQLVRQLRRAGVTTLLVEHDMRFAMSLGDEVTVLAAGRPIFQGKPHEAHAHEEVRREYLG